MEKIPATTENIQRWALFLKKIRSHFDQKGYFEVTTPHLVTVGAFEGTLDPLKVSWNHGQAELHTSPEIEMKHLLSSVRLPLYQICQCFRDDLEGPHHSKEFTMLEFYRPEATYQDLIQEMKGLIGILSPSPLSIETYSIEEVFKRVLQISLPKCDTKEKLLFEIEKKALISVHPSDCWEDLFFRLMMERIEPSLNPNVPTVLYHYPVLVSPLSKAIPHSLYAERFEIYWKGMELCNGCTELSDTETLKLRAQKENALRLQQGKNPHPFSQTLSNATQKLGQMAGVAVGLDRLFRCIPI